MRAIFNGTGTDWSGGYICLSSDEAYASDLVDDKFSSGLSANNGISSHRRVTDGTCSNWGH